MAGRIKDETDKFAKLVKEAKVTIDKIDKVKNWRSS
jgi:hypothetical protein